MNQLIVIWILLLNWIKPFSTNIIKIIGTVIALCLSFYIYNIYNQVQSQRIYVISYTKGCAKTDSEYLSLDFNYADLKDNNEDTIHSKLSDIKILSLTHTNNVFYNGDSIANCIAISKFDDELKSKINNIDYISNLYVGYDFYDNSWLFSHPTEPIRHIPQYQVIDTCRIDSFLCNLAYTNVEIDNNRPNLLGFYIGRKRHIMRMQSIFGSTTTDDTTSLLVESLRNNISIYEPHWYSAYDISKFQIDIIFDVDTLNQFNITFGGLTDIAEIQPSPDKKTLYGILYNDSEKLEFIRSYGLSLYLQFPKQESLQQTRNYVLSTFITLFLTILATLVFNLIRKVFYKRRLIKKTSKKLFSHHVNSYIFLKNNIIYIDCLATFIITLLIEVFNPYDWMLISKFCVSGIAIGSVLLFKRQYNNDIEKIESVKRYYKRIRFSGFVVFIISYSVFLINDVLNGYMFAFDAIAIIIGAPIGVSITLLPLYILKNKKKRK